MANGQGGQGGQTGPSGAGAGPGGAGWRERAQRATLRAVVMMCSGDGVALTYEQALALVDDVRSLAILALNVTVRGAP